jgi:hypothetical protein
MTDTHHHTNDAGPAEPSLLVRRGVVVGISLLTAAGWLVYDIGHPAQRAQGLAEIRRHFPEMLERPELLERGAADRAEAAPAAARPEGGRPDSEEVAPRAGFEPATNRLTAGCSTTELPGNTCRSGLPHGQGRAYIRAPEAVKAQLQVPRFFDVAYPDWQIQSPRSAHKDGADGPGRGASGGGRLLVAAGAGALDGARGAGGALGRFSAGQAIPAAERGEDVALVAGPAGEAEGREIRKPLDAGPAIPGYLLPDRSTKEKGPGEPGPKLGKWWGVFMGRQERHWPQMVNKWLTPRFPQGHLGHRSWFSSS